MTNLGKYLYHHSINKADIYYKTNISTNRLSSLSNDTTALLYAEEFYLIAKAIDKNVGEMANVVFKDLQPNKSSKEETDSKKLTDFGKYLSSFLNSKKNIAIKTGLLQSRISKLINDPHKRPYAAEIYLIAHALGKEPRILFDTLYNHLELNSEDRQKELRTKGKKEREQLKLRAAEKQVAYRPAKQGD